MRISDWSSDVCSSELVVTLLANNPEAGDPIQGSGGCRKVRVRKPGTGKSGGYRLITFYTGVEYPVFLITVFGKNERDNLTKAERNDLAKKIGRASWRARVCQYV